jgi:hypothetical protein
MGLLGKALVFAVIALSAWLLTALINFVSKGWVAKKHKFIQFLIYILLVLTLMAVVSF